MLKNIEEEIKKWDWKSQSVNSIPVSTVIARIDRGEYKIKETNINLETFDLSSFWFTTEDAFEFLTHVKLMENADLSYPIIINYKWNIIDWRHRICKAIMLWHKKIKAKVVINWDILN